MNNIETFQTNIENPTFIFIDGSYYCFHRFYALNIWWKNAFTDEELKIPIENDKFVDKFRKTFIENLSLIPKKLKLHKNINKPILIVAKDCKRENIWRTELFPNYKANRNYTEENGFMGGPFFKLVYEEQLFEKSGINTILSHPKLEADDCIALSVKYLLNKYPSCNIYIITGDKDYFQLAQNNVHIYSLNYKKLANTKNSTGDPIKDLKIKILMGDTSDNIPSSFPKCGFKTALKCVNDENFYNTKMNNIIYRDNYKLNETLISFDKIPQHLQNEFFNALL
jgi:5'-3' exonuclease